MNSAGASVIVQCRARPLMAPGPVAALILPIVLIGAGIGAAWAFVLQRVMSGAKGGEEDITAASAATVQQAGIALGAATAGLVANASGLDDGLDPGSVLRASLWGSLGARRGTSGGLCDRRAIEPDVPGLSPARTNRHV
jgi:predicted MFS family arabinose efflux permease